MFAEEAHPAERAQDFDIKTAHDRIIDVIRLANAINYFTNVGARGAILCFHVQDVEKDIPIYLDSLVISGPDPMIHVK
jgi:hypothetical protein